MRCGKMLKDEVAEYCEDCAKRKSYITQGRSLWLHQKPVSDALYRFKYHNKRCYGSVFSEKLAEKYEKKLKECCDIPIFHDDQHGTAVITLEKEKKKRL